MLFRIIFIVNSLEDNTMKKLFCIIALGLALCSLIGCVKKQPYERAKELPYELVKGDGAYYLVMDEEKYPAPDPEMCEYAPTVHFYTVGDMRDCFLNGKLTEKQLAELARFPRDKQGRIKIPDLDNLWDVTYPEGVVLKSVSLEAGWIFMIMDEPGGERFFVNQYSLKVFDDEMAYMESWPENDADQLTKQYMDTDRGAMVYLFEEKATKNVVYTITDERKTIFVREWYDLNKSETVADSVSVYIRENDVCIGFFLHEFSEPPTAEWISQFGIIDYKE
jgi:hypothetical protein